MMKSSDTQETHRRSSLYHRSHHKSPPNTWHPSHKVIIPESFQCVCVCVCVCEELRSSLELDQHCATLQMLLNPTSHCATKLSALKRRFTCCHWTLRSPDPTSPLPLYAAVGSSGPVSDQGFCQRRRSRSLFTDNASKEEAGSLGHGVILTIFRHGLARIWSGFFAEFCLSLVHNAARDSLVIVTCLFDESSKKKPRGFCVHTNWKQLVCQNKRRFFVRCHSETVSIWRVLSASTPQVSEICSVTSKSSYQEEAVEPWMNIPFSLFLGQGSTPPLRGRYHRLTLKSGLGADSVYILLPAHRVLHTSLYQTGGSGNA